MSQSPPCPPLTVWVFVTTFPSLTTTFLVRRIQGLIARGFSIHIIAEGHGELRTPAPEQEALLPLVRWAFPVGKRFARLAEAFLHVATVNPAVACHACDPLRFRNLAGPKLLAVGALLRDLPPPDVVLGCFGSQGELACALRALGFFSAPVVTSFHGVDAYGKPPDHLHRRYRLLRQRGDLYLPVSHHMADRLMQAGLDGRRMQVLHTPIRCAQFQWRPPQPQPSGQPLKIIGLGRLAEKKGFLDSLHVIAALVRSGRAVHFDLYGEGVQRQELERLAQQLGIVDKVAFHGPVAHDVAIAAFSKAHLFLSTNRVASNGDCEGIPNTIKEAMAIGLPVVATRHSGTPELVVDGEHGLLADEGDVPALANACTRFADDHALALRCAVAARQRVETQFDETQLNDRLADLLLAQINRTRSGEAACVE